MKHYLLLLAVLVLTACSAEQETAVPSTPIDPVCRHVWQTGYNGIGQLVIGHPATPCHTEEHPSRSIEEEFIEELVGIEESPLPPTF